MSNESRFIRRRTSGVGWNGGDIDTAIALFCNGFTWDGDVPSKECRDHLVSFGYAARYEGMQALTGRGKLAALFCWPMPRVWSRMVWRDGLKVFFGRARSDSP